MHRLYRGFTLIELMIVVAIIGILASLAIPAYRDYVARTQVTEALELLSGTKTPLSEFYADNGRWPGTLSLDVLVGNTCQNGSSCKYTNSLTLSGAVGTTGTLLVVATMKTSDVHPSIAGKQVSLQSGTAKEWDCISINLGAAYLPNACK